MSLLLPNISPDSWEPTPQLNCLRRTERDSQAVASISQARLALYAVAVHCSPPPCLASILFFVHVFLKIALSCLSFFFLFFMLPPSLVAVNPCPKSPWTALLRHLSLPSAALSLSPVATQQLTSFFVQSSLKGTIQRRGFSSYFQMNE